MAPEQSTPLDDPAVFSIRSIGGQCPVQGDGTINGDRVWYFRSRGEQWTFEVWPAGVDFIDGYELPHVTPSFMIGGAWGDGPFRAGYMPVEEAERLIREAAQKFYLRLAAGRTL